MDKNIENLVSRWDKAANAIMISGEYHTQEIEQLLRETYKFCTEYKDDNLVPKEFCKIFVHMNRFTSYLVGACHIDEFTTPSDAAEYNAIAYIIDEIEYGFYTGKYECTFPNIKADNNQGNSYILNMENEFLEYFIEENR